MYKTNNLHQMEYDTWGQEDFSWLLTFSCQTLVMLIWSDITQQLIDLRIGRGANDLPSPVYHYTSLYL